MNIFPRRFASWASILGFDGSGFDDLDFDGLGFDGLIVFDSSYLYCFVILTKNRMKNEH